MPVLVSLGVFNVRDFCALGDGTSDDTSAFKAAALAAASGGWVFIPAGIYIVSAPIYWRSNTHVFGAGRGSSIVRRKSGSIVNGMTANTAEVFTTGSADGVFYTVSAHGTNISFADLTIDGNAAGNTGVTDPNVGAHGIRGHFTDYMQTQRVEVINCLESGVYLWGCRRSAHFGSVARSNGLMGVAASRNGFSVTGPQDDATDQGAQDEHQFLGCESISNTDEGLAVGRNGLVSVIGGVYRDNGDMGIEGDSGTATADTTSVPAGWIISGVHVFNNGTSGVGLSNSNVQRVSITGCVIEGHAQHGISTSFSSGSLLVISNNIVRTFASAGSTFHGITVGSFDRVAIANNIVSDGNASGGAGIVLLGQAVARQVSITGNVVYNVNDSCISVTGKATGVISGNDVEKSLGATGITVQGGTDGVVDLLVANNVCRNSGLYGIRVRTTATGNIVGCALRGNICTDDQVTKTQDYGLAFSEAGGGTITALVVDHNDLEGNQTGRITALTNAMLAVIETPRRTQSIAFAASVTPDGLAGEDVEVGALTANITINAPTSPFKGLRLRFRLLQDGTGGRTVTWNAGFKQAWSNTGNTANKQSMIAFRYDGTNWVQEGAQSPYV